MVTVPTSNRTVHPFLTGAVVAALVRHRIDAPGLDDAVRAVAEGDPLGEDAHRQLKVALYDGGGPWASFDAGYRLGRTGSHPLVALLAESRDPLEVADRFLRLEPLLHVGNRSRIAMNGNGMDVHHDHRLGPSPLAAESLFVCGAQCGVLVRIGVRSVRIEVASGHATVVAWPRRERPSHPPHPHTVNRWRVDWRTAPVRSALQTSASATSDVRRAVADHPEADWTVARLAAALHLSTRTLQRRLAAERTTASRQVLLGRLDAAAALLARTDLPVTVIAYACGFADPAHLANASRKLHGVTPTARRASRPVA